MTSVVNKGVSSANIPLNLQLVAETIKIDEQKEVFLKRVKNIPEKDRARFRQQIEVVASLAKQKLLLITTSNAKAFAISAEKIVKEMSDLSERLLKDQAIFQQENAKVSQDLGKVNEKLAASRVDFSKNLVGTLLMTASTGAVAGLTTFCVAEGVGNATAKVLGARKIKLAAHAFGKAIQLTAQMTEKHAAAEAAKAAATRGVVNLAEARVVQATLNETASALAAAAARQKTTETALNQALKQTGKSMLAKAIGATVAAAAGATIGAAGSLLLNSSEAH